MIKEYLQSFGILNNDEIEKFEQNLITQKILKNSYLIKEGEICNEVAFILNGIFRSYYTTEKGDEITYCLTFPQNFITAYSSFITGNGSKENIQAITNAEILIINKQYIQNLESNNSNWTKFLKVIAEQQYINLENRIFEFQKNNALERYNNLINHHPEYVQNIPLQHLASFLGITQRHLSRIRREIDLSPQHIEFKK
jgi:CRP-like cAMP-binding protein